jgi:hypothetical protein
MKRLIFPVEMSKTWITTGDTTFCDVKYNLAYRDKKMKELMGILLGDPGWLNFYKGAVGSTRKSEADEDNIEIARNISNDKAKARMERDLRSVFYKMRDLLMRYSCLFHEAAESADDAVKYHLERRKRMMEKTEKEAEKLEKAREVVAGKASELAEAAKIVEALKTGKANEIVKAVNEYCEVAGGPVVGTVLEEILGCIRRATEKAKAGAEAVKEAAAEDPVWRGMMDEIFNAMLEFEKVKIGIKEGKDNAR